MARPFLVVSVDMYVCVLWSGGGGGSIGVPIFMY